MLGETKQIIKFNFDLFLFTFFLMWLLEIENYKQIKNYLVCLMLENVDIDTRAQLDLAPVYIFQSSWILVVESVADWLTGSTSIQDEHGV